MSFWKRGRVHDSIHHTGSDCYKYVDKMLHYSRELMISSPFVDSYYADFLHSSSHGKKVFLLSSSIDPRALRIIGKRPHPFAFTSIVALLLVLDAAEFYTGLLTTASILATVSLAAVFAIFMLRGRGNVVVRRPPGFVHMKMYISESQAIQGSANLTFNGMHRNVEHIEIINDPEVVSQLRKEFMKLWHGSM